MTQACTKCFQEKPISEFELNRKKPRRQCKVCRNGKERSRLWYLKNRERQIAKAAQWHAENRERSRLATNMRNATNREELRAKDKARRAVNPEKYKAYRRQYVADNRERIRELLRADMTAHPEKFRERGRISAARHNARKRQFPATFTRRERTFMLQHFGYACAACGNQEGFTHFLADDHWIPLTHPDCPGTVAWNMIPLCHGLNGCNNSKCNTDAAIWLIRKFGKRKAVLILKRIEAYFEIVKQRAIPSTEVS